MAVPRKLLAPLIIALAAGAALFLGFWVRNSRPPIAMAPRPPAGGLECGQWAVFRTCELMGVPVSPRAIREMMPAGPRGHSLKDIADSLQRAGLVTQGRKESFETFLSGEGTRIVHIASPEHFLVVVRSGPNRIFYFDHQGRRRSMPCSQLRESWSGAVLYVERPPLAVSLGFVQREVPDGQPRVQFETLFIDKGDIATEASPRTVQFDFPFRNNGKSDLLIKKVHTTCACLVAKKPEHPVGPENTGTITLQYSVDDRRNTFLHEALVETNDPAFPVLVLRAAGNTNALVSVSPPILDLGSIPFGQERRAYLFIRYSGEEDFAVRGARSTLSGISLTVHETLSRELADQLWPHAPPPQAKLSRATRVLEVVASPSGEGPGELKGELTIETNIDRFETVKVPVTGKVINPVAMVPSLLSFGEVEPGEPIERSLVLVSLVNKPFRVVTVAPEAEGLKWTVAPAPQNAQGVQLRFSTTGMMAHTLSGSTLNVRVESDGRQFDLGVPVFAAKK